MSLLEIPYRLAGQTGLLHSYASVSHRNLPQTKYYLIEQAKEGICEWLFGCSHITSRQHTETLEEEGSVFVFLLQDIDWQFMGAPSSCHCLWEHPGCSST